MNTNSNTANRKSFKNPTFPQISNILSQFNKLLQSIFFYNLKNYVFRNIFRNRVNALIRPWLIFSAVCLIGIYVSLMINLVGK